MQYVYYFWDLKWDFVANNQTYRSEYHLGNLHDGLLDFLKINRFETSCLRFYFHLYELIKHQKNISLYYHHLVGQLLDLFSQHNEIHSLENLTNLVDNRYFIRFLIQKDLLHFVILDLHDIVYMSNVFHDNVKL